MPWSQVCRRGCRTVRTRRTRGFRQAGAAPRWCGALKAPAVWALAWTCLQIVAWPRLPRRWRCKGTNGSIYRAHRPGAARPTCTAPSLRPPAPPAGHLYTAGARGPAAAAGGDAGGGRAVAAGSGLGSSSSRSSSGGGSRLGPRRGGGTPNGLAATSGGPRGSCCRWQWEWWWGRRRWCGPERQQLAGRRRGPPGVAPGGGTRWVRVNARKPCGPGWVHGRAEQGKLVGDGCGFGRHPAPGSSVGQDCSLRLGHGKATPCVPSTGCGIRMRCSEGY